MSAPAPAPIGPMAVNFAFLTTAGGLTATGTPPSGGVNLGTFTLQDADHTKNADQDDNRDAGGCVMQITFYNQNQEAKLEVLVTSATGIADAIAQSKIADVGTIVSITACASYPALVATNWIVMPGASLKKGNTNSAKISYPLKAYPGITAVTPA